MEEPQKRFRTPNYTSEEMNVLLNIIVQFKHITENKKTDAVTWREKDAVWKRIAELFNASAPSGVVRAPESLKKAYENKKKNVRKLVAAERCQVRKTRGGNEKIPHDPNTKIAISLLNKKTMYGLKNNSDCDAGSSSSNSSPGPSNLDDEPGLSNFDGCAGPTNFDDSPNNFTYDIQKLTDDCSIEIIHEEEASVLQLEEVISIYVFIFNA